jgi:hypothetical protein
MNVEPVPTLIRLVNEDDYEITDSYWAFSVPRTNDTLRRLGGRYLVVNVEWEPQGFPVVQQRATVTLRLV